MRRAGKILFPCAVLTPCLRRAYASPPLLCFVSSLFVFLVSLPLSLSHSLSLSNSLSLYFSLSFPLSLSLVFLAFLSLSLYLSLSLSLKRCYTGTPGHRTYDKYTGTPGHQEAPYLRNKSPSCNVGSPRCEGGSLKGRASSQGWGTETKAKAEG